MQIQSFKPVAHVAHVKPMATLTPVTLPQRRSLQGLMPLMTHAQREHSAFAVLNHFDRTLSSIEVTDSGGALPNFFSTYDSANEAAGLLEEAGPTRCVVAQVVMDECGAVWTHDLELLWRPVDILQAAVAIAAYNVAIGMPTESADLAERLVPIC